MGIGRVNDNEDDVIDRSAELQVTVKLQRRSHGATILVARGAAG